MGFKEGTKERVGGYIVARIHTPFNWIGIKRENKVRGTYLQALTNCPGVRRHGYAANLVAITMLSLTFSSPEKIISL